MNGTPEGAQLGARRKRDAAALSLPGVLPGNIDVLLEGFSDADPFAAFEPDAVLARIWRAHRAELLAEARRRKIREPFGRRFDLTPHAIS